MMRLLLRTDEKALRAAACRIALERGIWTFRQGNPGQSPQTRMVELSVGDASLEIPAAEVAEVVAALVG
jgi:hypothetical protein